jgi:pilus assembly protein CpaE
MLTAGIVSADSSSSAHLLASLQQTGLVSSVKQWIIPVNKLPEIGEIVPDVVILDLGRDPETYFAFGAHVRRLRPPVRLIVCSSTNPPSPQLLLDAMRCGVQEFIPKPATPESLREILIRLDLEGPTTERRAAEKLIVLMGSKGGVGTTTVSVNLAVQLRTFAHKSVALLDFARPLGNVHLLLDLHPRFGIRDAVENVDRLDSHFFAGLLTHHKSKVEILGGTLQPEEWQTIPPASLERVANVAQAGFDMVLADIGSQFSSDWSSLLRSARMILLVAEANVPSLWTLERRMVALTGFGIEPERVRVIINRWHKGDEEVLKSIEKDIKRPIFASLPNDFQKASLSVNLGTPLMENHNNSLSNRYRQLASQIAGITSTPVVKRGGIGNLFSLSTKTKR